MARKGYTSFLTNDKAKIEPFIAEVSSSMFEYVKKNNNSSFVMFYKNITHSDLPAFGKALSQDSHENNILYYISTEEMIKIEQATQKPFQTAHQSNIGLSKELYKLIKMPDPRNKEQYLINDYYDVLLVNDNLRNIFLQRKLLGQY